MDSLKLCLKYTLKYTVLICEHPQVKIHLSFTPHTSSSTESGKADLFSVKTHVST